MEIHSGAADINGTKLYYEVAGEGFPLVMVHAAIADHRMWDAQLEALAEHFRVVRYDQRGFGQSPLGAGPFSYRDDLRELLRFLQIPRAFLMGCSMGGSTVIDFALEYPEQTAGVITVCGGMSGFPYEEEEVPFEKEMDEAEKAGNIELAAEYSTRIWFDSQHRTPEQMDPDLRALVIDMTRLALLQNVDPSQVIRPDVSAYDRLDQLKTPLLAITGDLDVQGIQDVADTLSAVVPGAKKVVLSGAAHLPNMERPQEFNQLVLSFLTSVSEK